MDLVSLCGLGWIMWACMAKGGLCGLVCPRVDIVGLYGTV